MKSLRAFLLGFVMVSLCAPLAPANAQVEPDGGLYFGVRGGLSQVRNLSFSNLVGFPATYTTVTDPIDGTTSEALVSQGLNDHEEDRSLEMDYGWVVGASIGYTVLFPDNSADLRFEVEGIYRRNDNGQIRSNLTPSTNNPDSVSFEGYTNLPLDGWLEVRSAMFNVIVDFHTPTRVVPYIGLGAGMSQLVAQGTVAGAPFDDDLFALSWQAIAGIGYKLSPGTLVFLETRYFRLAADRWSDLFNTDELRDVTFDDWSMGVRLTF